MFWKSTIVFICAVVFFATTKSQNETEKLCLLVNKIYPRYLWDYMAGYNCYIYTNSYRLNGQNNITGRICNDCRNKSVPVTMINETAFFTYNYKDADSIPYLKKSFKTDHFFEMWQSCAKEAADCCDNEMTNENIIPTTSLCPVVWDSWTCFPATQVGTIQKQKCSSQAYSTDSDVCELESEKECFANGTWKEKTDYTVCAMAPVLRNRHFFNVVVLAVAAVLEFPSVVIFFSLRSLRQKLRFVLHRNLILVIVIRNVLSIMSKEIIILDALNTNGNKVMVGNSVACRVLAFFENAAKNGMYACMLADGFYLHKLIVRAFADEPNLTHIYAFVFVLSFLPSIIWAIVRDQHGATDCWIVDQTNDQWIIDGFRMVVLAVNLLLLLDIIRVMIMKLRHGNLSRQTISTLKATLFLIPLFGVYIIVITDRNMVPSNTCKAVDIYYYISYLIEGLQGVMVATLFCYLNSEVQGELKNAYRKFILSLESRFVIQLQKKSNCMRRPTTATYVDSYDKPKA